MGTLELGQRVVINTITHKKSMMTYNDLHDVVEAWQASSGQWGPLNLSCFRISQRSVRLSILHTVFKADEKKYHLDSPISFDAALLILRMAECSAQGKPLVLDGHDDAPYNPYHLDKERTHVPSTNFTDHKSHHSIAILSAMVSNIVANADSLRSPVSHDEITTLGTDHLLRAFKVASYDELLVCKQIQDTQSEVQGLKKSLVK